MKKTNTSHAKAKNAGISVHPLLLSEFDAVFNKEELRVKLTRSQIIKELMSITIKVADQIDISKITSEGDLQYQLIKAFKTL